MLPYWAIGVILSLSGCTLSNVGVNLQKVGHKGHDLDDEIAVYSSPIWILGISMVVLGSIIDFTSYAFAEVSLLAPLGAMTIGRFYVTLI